MGDGHGWRLWFEWSHGPTLSLKKVEVVWTGMVGFARRDQRRMFRSRLERRYLADNGNEGVNGSGGDNEGV